MADQPATGLSIPREEQHGLPIRTNRVPAGAWDYFIIQIRLVLPNFHAKLHIGLLYLYFKLGICSQQRRSDEMVHLLRGVGELFPHPSRIDFEGRRVSQFLLSHKINRCFDNAVKLGRTYANRTDGNKTKYFFRTWIRASGDSPLSSTYKRPYSFTIFAPGNGLSTLRI